MPGNDIDYLEGGRVLHPNKNSAIWVSGPEALSLMTLSFASVLPKNIYGAGVLGHYFNFGPPILFHSGAPLRAEFSAAGDAVVLAQMQTGTTVYLYGITVEKLIGWVPPARKDEVDVTGLCATWSVPREDILTLKKLKKTDTHDLPGMTDLLISYIAAFKNIKVRSAADVIRWAAQTFEKNIKQVLLQGEMEDRRLAALHAGRGQRKNQAAASGSGGAEAGENWKLLRDAVQKAMPFYREPFDERFAGNDDPGRFFNVALQEDTGLPSPETITELKRFLSSAASLTAAYSLDQPNPHTHLCLTNTHPLTHFICAGRMSLPCNSQRH